MPTTKDVDEHPIIFNSWSINHILAGKKTQTRRVVEPQPPHEFVHALDLPPRYCDENTTGYLKNGPGWYWRAQTAVDEAKWRPLGSSRGCPYGKPGARLWVREAFRLPSGVHSTPKEYVEHCGDRTPVVKYEADESTNADCSVGLREWNGTLKPSIHMPRELCRIRLRVKDVRVEQVQEVSHKDAKAEGVDPKNALAPCGVMEMEDSYRARFAQVWNDIHGDGAWERNDWVWVIEFSRLEP